MIEISTINNYVRLKLIFLYVNILVFLYLHVFQSGVDKSPTYLIKHCNVQGTLEIQKHKSWEWL